MTSPEGKEKSSSRHSGRWKSRFGIGKRNKKAAKKGKNDDTEGLLSSGETDDVAARSLSAKRNQRAAAKPEKKGRSIIRKLNIKTSVGKDVKASDPSPSNPQSPYSNDSYVTVEVRHCVT